MKNRLSELKVSRVARLSCQRIITVLLWGHYKLKQFYRSNRNFLCTSILRSYICSVFFNLKFWLTYCTYGPIAVISFLFFLVLSKQQPFNICIIIWSEHTHFSNQPSWEKLRGRIAVPSFLCNLLKLPQHWSRKSKSNHEPEKKGNWFPIRHLMVWGFASIYCFQNLKLKNISFSIWKLVKMDKKRGFEKLFLSF